MGNVIKFKTNKPCDLVPKELPQIEIIESRISETDNQTKLELILTLANGDQDDRAVVAEYIGGLIKMWYRNKKFQVTETTIKPMGGADE